MDSLNILLLLIYSQFAFWIILFYKNLNIDYLKKSFYIVGLLFIFTIYIYKFSIDFYHSHYFISYAIFVMFVTYIFNMKYDFRISLCLGFMLVFTNSYFWEFPIHLIGLVQNSLTLRFIIQSMHLIYFPIFLLEFDFKENKKIIDLIIYSLALGFIIQIFNMGFWSFKGFNEVYIMKNISIGFFTLYINRIISLLILIKIFYYYSELKNN